MDRSKARVFQSPSLPQALETPSPSPSVSRRGSRSVSIDVSRASPVSPSTPRTGDLKSTTPSTPSPRLSTRKSDALELVVMEGPGVRGALGILDEAHRRLKRRVDDRGGQSRLAQPSGASVGRPGAGHDVIDADAPDILARLTVLRREIMAAVALIEKADRTVGMSGGAERREVIAQMQTQLTRVERAYKRWLQGLPQGFDPQGVTLEPIRDDSGAASPKVRSWAQVQAACELLVAPDTGSLQKLLRERMDSVVGTLAHHPAHLPRLLATKALYWEAAAEILEAIQGRRDLKSHRPRTPSPSQGSLDGKHAPRGEVEPAGAEAGTDPIEVLARRCRARHEGLMAKARDPNSAGRLGDPAVVLGLGPTALTAPTAPVALSDKERKAQVERIVAGASFPDQSGMPERDLALACIQRALADSAEKGRWSGKSPSDKSIEKLFDKVYSQLRSRQTLATIRTRVVVPTSLPTATLSDFREDGVGKSALTEQSLGQRLATRPVAVVCEMRPAREISEALARSLESDGVQGAHCHERTQHKHAVTLFSSQMADEEGHPLMTLTRHGVLSANQLTRLGIQSLSDEDLYRVAVDLAGQLAEPPFNDHRLANALTGSDTRLVPSDKDLAEPTPARVKEIAGLVRGKWPSTLSGALREAKALFDKPQPPLIDMMRRAANLNRAREAAEAALCSLPDHELDRLLRQDTLRDGKYEGGPRVEAPVTVRLASVSLMTPDWARRDKHLVATTFSFFGKSLVWRGAYKDDEQSMWRDQLQAWKDLTATGEVRIPRPRRGEDGRLRDESGCLRTVDAGARDAMLRVRFEVAASNVAVNKWGTRGEASEYLLGFNAESDRTNRPTLEKILGAPPAEWAQWPPRLPQSLKKDSWLGAYLYASKEQVPDAERRILCTLASQIARIYTSRAHLQAGDDPYKLATRLLVLTNRLQGLDGAPPVVTLVNCKSGKDRTSVADTEAQQMALEIATTGKVPPLDEPVTELRSRQLGVLHEAGGSRPLQAWNTGMSGTKLKQPALYRRFLLDTKDRIEAFLGLSKYTKS